MLAMATKLNVGCGPHYAPGWLNTDLVFIDNIKPDVVVDPAEPFPFDDGTFERAYLGHVLEHVPWGKLPDFLADLTRVLKPGAPVMFVGPDAYRAIDAYKAGTATIHQVKAVIEGPSAYYELLGIYDPGWRWEGDRHHWNCTEDRVVAVLTNCGFTDIQPYGVDVNGELPEGIDAEWPVVSRAALQFAVSARTPS